MRHFYPFVTLKKGCAIGQLSTTLSIAGYLVTLNVLRLSASIKGASLQCAATRAVSDTADTLSIPGIALKCRYLSIPVGLKAPITVRDLHSEVRRDWKQLIGRKLAHSTAVKTGLGESPKKRETSEE
jgi:hypothetical protein